MTDRDEELHAIREIQDELIQIQTLMADSALILERIIANLEPPKEERKSGLNEPSSTRRD